jgi:hypothetical protein
MDISPWITLFETYVGSFSYCENYRSFRAHFGVHPEVAELLYVLYGNNFLNRVDILILLHFLKVYPTEDRGSRLFNFGSRNTYRGRLWRVVDYLDSIMSEIDLNNRFDGEIAKYGLFEDIALVVDGTDCPIERPNNRKENSSVLKWLRRIYYSGREKDNLRSRYSVKYTLAVQISTGKICFLDGPRPGSINDIRALRESNFMSQLRDQNLDELVIADKGYEGLPNFLTPFKKAINRELTGEEEAFNLVLAQVRFIVECSIGRMKIFSVLSQRYRKPLAPKSLLRHKKITNIIAQITNLSLDREPLSYHQNNLIY